MNTRQSRPTRSATAGITIAILLGLVTPVVVGLAAAPPAQADACSTSTGVTVLVDFNGIGSGADVQGTCVASGGGITATDLFPEAGFALTEAPRQPGFVCRVSAVPQSDPCVDTSPANAYWSLWWSDGRSGEWTYSTLGVVSLRVPDGGYLAFAWDDTLGYAIPSYTPTPHTPLEPAPVPADPTTNIPDTPSDPTPTHSTSGSAAGADGMGGAAGNLGPTPAKTGPEGNKPENRDTPTPSPGSPDSNGPKAPTAPTTVDTSPTQGASPTPVVPDPVEQDLADPTIPRTSNASGEGLPTWVPLATIAALLVAFGSLVQRNRRNRKPDAAPSGHGEQS